MQGRNNKNVLIAKEKPELWNLKQGPKFTCDVFSPCFSGSSYMSCGLQVLGEPPSFHCDGVTWCTREQDFSLPSYQVQTSSGFLRRWPTFVGPRAQQSEGRLVCGTRVLKTALLIDRDLVETTPPRVEQQTNRQPHIRPSAHRPFPLPGDSVPGCLPPV